MNPLKRSMWLLPAISALLAPARPAGAVPGRPASPVVFLSPVPGARGILPETNVIVRLNAPLATEPDGAPVFSLTGSVSGPHPGTLKVLEGGRALVFQPDQPFALGEDVSVAVSGSPIEVERSLAPLTSFSFSITPARLPRVDTSLESELGEAGATSAVSPAHAAGLERITTSSPPPIVSTVYGPPAAGAIFMSSFTSLTGPPAFLLIVDDFGNPYFYRSQPSGCLDFKEQPNGQLTYYDYAQAKFYVMDSTYTVIDSIAAGNGYYTDGHELRLLPNGHALLMSYDGEPVDMSLVVPGGNPNATVIGLVIQELDESRNVIFQWRSWDHFQITDATHENLTASLIDCVHGNAIELDTDGNLMISSRHLDEITKIDRTTGDIIWRMGGKHNQFKFLNDPIGFSHQHAIRRIANGDVTLFDNGNFHSPSFSRAVEYQLDEVNLDARLVWQYRNTPDSYGFAMGYVQRLDNGNTIVSWGTGKPELTEVAPDGSKILDLLMPDGTHSYRSFRFPWLADSTPVLSAPRGVMKLSPLSPNPTHGRTSLVVNLLRETPVSVRLYDVAGRVVQDIAEDARHGPGLYRVPIDLSGSPDGIYFLRLAAGREVELRKVVRMR